MNSFGRIFSVHIFGESHGSVIGICIDGCPVGIPLHPTDFVADIERRKSGTLGTTSRIEDDVPEIISGIFNAHTTGAPLTLIFKNSNVQSKGYDKTKEIPRPGHADFTGHIKHFGFNDYRGGGHFSGRLTLPLVAAGVIAKKIIAPMSVNAKIISVLGSNNIDEIIEKITTANDSAGALIGCTIENVSAGLGEPFFDSIESLISHIVFAIPGIKGIEFGSGFAAAAMKGSEHNDTFLDDTGKTLSNNAGGINGGISNSNPIVFRVAVKPTSSIGMPQQTYNFSKNKMDTLIVEGRHDACFALRLPPVIEAAAAIAMADLLLINKSQKSFNSIKS